MLRQAYSTYLQDKEQRNQLLQSIELSLKNSVPEGARLSSSDLQKFLLSETENTKIYVLHRPVVFNIKTGTFQKELSV